MNVLEDLSVERVQGHAGLRARVGKEVLLLAGLFQFPDSNH